MINLTHSQKPAEAQKQENRAWLVIDAAGVPLGRLATQIATLLRGKHKPTYTPHVDGGDHVVVLNAEQVKLTGHKAQNMQFHYHTGWIGGLKTIIAGDELKGAHPERLIQRAVERMMPKDSPLSRAMFSKLHVYKGSNHPHAGQNPTVIQPTGKVGK
jgi:large subunit ribosomal protein L13